MFNKFFTVGSIVAGVFALSASPAMAAKAKKKASAAPQTTTATAESAPAPAAPEAPRHRKGLVHELSGQGYGPAGCGLGSILFGSDPSKVQIFAATSNGWMGNQTFGISTGTLNCVDSATLSKMQRAELFVAVNRQAVEQDITRGQGETLNNLASIFNCTDAQALGSELKVNYPAIFPSNDVTSESVGINIFKTIHDNKKLSSSCKTSA